MKRYLTSESVCEGHPDKLCDFISDSILDAYLEQDPNSRVACEVMAGKHKVFITGEITSNGVVDVEKIARDAIREIGYNKDNGLDYETCIIDVDLSHQSSDIAMGVDASADSLGEGAGDQGLMFGYANSETENYMPLALNLAHKLTKRLADVRKEGIIPYLRPDGKGEVTIEYSEDGSTRVDTIVISAQHDEVDLDVLKKDIKKYVIDYVFKDITNTKIYINPTGRFVIGGPLGDSGLTGRKIIVDTYGGYAHHGGGAFSGKDATKVDRSAAYMARCIAKNVVANGYAKECEIGLSYVIGYAKPISVNINTYGTNTISEEEILSKIEKNFPLTPKGIIEYLDLRKPIYKKTTNYGHFGKEGLPWEKVIKF